MKNQLTQSCINNILGHIKNCWNYDYPTGKTLETAIFRGIEPFYANAKLLGSPSTIVDVGKNNEAFDIKGCKKLGHMVKIVKSSNHVMNNFAEQLFLILIKLLFAYPKALLLKYVDQMLI